jgi:hypothetical protein
MQTGLGLVPVKALCIRARYQISSLTHKVSSVVEVPLHIKLLFTVLLLGYYGVQPSTEQIWIVYRGTESVRNW